MPIKIKEFTRGVTTTLDKNAPAILTGLGVVGLFTTVGLAVKATPKALQILRSEADNQGLRLEDEDLSKLHTWFTPKEVVLLTWKAYMPSVVTGVFTAGCIIGANSLNAKRRAALLAAYSITEKTYREYQDKVKEVVGEKKEREVRTEVAKDAVKNSKEDHNIVGDGYEDSILCFDKLSGRYFSSSVNRLYKAEVNFNKRMMNDYWANLNDFYTEIGLAHIAIGETLGWNTENMVELETYAGMTHDDKPCLVMDFANPPKANFR